jgi:hypothetical protein
MYVAFASMLEWLLRRNTGPPPQSGHESIPDVADSPLPEEVFLDAARHFLDVQLSTLDVLDTKTAQTFSVGSLALPVTFALLNLGTSTVPTIAKWALGIALAFYVGLLACAFLASLIRALEYRPNITTLKGHSERYEGIALERWVANEYEASIQENTRGLVRKARWVGAATLAAYLEALSLSFAAIATLLL